MKRTLLIVSAVVVVGSLSVFYFLRPQPHIKLESHQSLEQPVQTLTASHTSAVSAETPQTTQTTVPVSTPTTPSDKATPEAPPVTPPSIPTNPQPVAVKSVTPKPPAPTCSGSFNNEFLCLLNNYRASKGKGKLSYTTNLSSVALAYSGWMATTNTFSHIGENGSHFYERCQAAGTTCRAENLANGAQSAQSLFEMWKASPAHNANMLGSYTTIGLGISGGYATALFN